MSIEFEFTATKTSSEAVVPKEPPDCGGFPSLKERSLPVSFRDKVLGEKVTVSMEKVDLQTRWCNWNT